MAPSPPTAREPDRAAATSPDPDRHPTGDPGGGSRSPFTRSPDARRTRGEPW
ncbi:hypothetical protein [Halalkalicoccus tibetensis]|uniref:Uncharacterized protein n=1 Tax=Halalkalicoccus tibetensis TaxID=175632 RepID=A0ABD5V9B7_9EURY